MTHDEYISDLETLQSELSQAVGQIQTLKLTPEEQAVIEALPKEKHDKIEELLARYQPGPFDIRREIIYKGVAMLLLKSGSALQKAWALGQKAGVSFG